MKHASEYKLGINLHNEMHATVTQMENYFAYAIHNILYARIYDNVTKYLLIMDKEGHARDKKKIIL